MIPSCKYVFKMSVLMLVSAMSVHTTDCSIKELMKFGLPAVAGFALTISGTLGALWLSQQSKQTQDLWLFAPIPSVIANLAAIGIALGSGRVTGGTALRYTVGSVAGGLGFYHPLILLPTTMTMASR